MISLRTSRVPFIKPKKAFVSIIITLPLSPQPQHTHTHKHTSPEKKNNHIIEKKLRERLILHLSTCM